MKENLKYIALSGIGIGSGIITGTIDVLTTGIPLLSGYLECSALFQLPWFNPKDNFLNATRKDFLLGNLSYLSGVAIPFGFKYSNEIYHFIEGFLK